MSKGAWIVVDEQGDTYGGFATVTEAAQSMGDPAHQSIRWDAEASPTPAEALCSS
jgi:hypothetical protein